MFEPYKKLLTIGIPTYNEEKYIKQTILSCIDQAGVVVVSDNASTDGTEKICRELAEKYPNLLYVRQQENIGEIANFNFVLNKATSKYFMWCGGHDYLDPNSTCHAVHLLEKSNAAGCFPASRSVDLENNEMGIYDCWYAHRLSSDSALQRVYTLICHLHEVSLFYGVYKTELAKKHPYRKMIGSDHEFVCAMAMHGRLLFSPRTIFNWRQTKFGISDADKVKIWEETLGDKNKKVEGSRQEMKDIQLAILKQCKPRGLIEFFRKPFLVRNARNKLNKRF